MAAIDLSLRRAAGDDAEKAAKGLEAHFIRQMLSEMRSSSPGGLLDDGFAGSTFREMLDEKLADQMAAGGGIGIAKAVQRELEKGVNRSTLLTEQEPGGAHRSTSLTCQGSAGANRSISLTCPASSVRAYARTALTIQPVDGAITSPFGARLDPLDGDLRGHAGLDLRAPAGSPARAAGAGTVVRAEAAGGYGNLVVVDHGGGLETRYAHLAHIDVEPGQRIEAGQSLGLVGATGRTTGPHLHFEVRRDGRAIDPEREKTGLKFSR
jgi:murein DD-endopeptidase MepM/ murein hydrolase activator NlpD